MKLSPEASAALCAWFHAQDEPRQRPERRRAPRRLLTPAEAQAKRERLAKRERFLLAHLHRVERALHGASPTKRGREQRRADAIAAAIYRLRCRLDKPHYCTTCFGMLDHSGACMDARKHRSPCCSPIT